MINGAHAVIFSTDPEADRSFFRDVLKMTHVDVGDGWLIFQLPPSELAVHPSEKNDVHEIYLTCDDIDAFVAELKNRDIRCGPVQTPRWGRLTDITLPGGGTLSVYEPMHEQPGD